VRAEAEGSVRFRDSGEEGVRHGRGEIIVESA
jgi:hypothetical protein